LTAGPDIKCTLAPKSLERFKQRIRHITRRANGVSTFTILVTIHRPNDDGNSTKVHL